MQEQIYSLIQEIVNLPNNSFWSDLDEIFFETDQAQTVLSAFILNVTWYKITQPTETNWLVPAYPLCINIEPINRSNGYLLFHCKF